VTKPFLVFEDLASTSRRRLFTILGVEWVATTYAWVGPLFFSLLGILMSELAHSGLPIGERLVRGFGYGLFLYLSNTVHSLGHIVFGRVVGAPMNANLLTATRDVNVYEGDRRTIPEGLRVARSLGGPASNAILGTLILLTGYPVGSDWLRNCGYLSLGVAIWTLMPVPTLDGWIVWKAVWTRLQL
jgi:Zn-dependent protease